MEIISKKDAMKKGLKFYFTGKPCRRGHLCERYVACAKCIECNSINRKEWRAENPERTNDLRREWRKKNPEKEKESHTRSNKKWWSKAKVSENAKKRRARKQNPEKFREERNRSYKKIRLLYPERIKAQQAKWRQANPERVKEITKKATLSHRERNPLYMRLKAQERRSAVRKNGGSHTVSDIENILKLQRNKCAYCRIGLRGKFHIDHIVPVSGGGTNDRRNIQLLCEPCNLKKWRHDPIDFSRQRGMLL